MLPPAIYLAGGGAALPEIADQLSLLQWTEYLPFSKQPTIRVLTPSDVRDVYDTTGLLVGSQDITPMGLAHHAIQLDSEEDQPLGGRLGEAASQEVRGRYSFDRMTAAFEAVYRSELARRGMASTDSETVLAS